MVCSAICSPRPPRPQRDQCIITARRAGKRPSKALPCRPRLWQAVGACGSTPFLGAREAGVSGRSFGAGPVARPGFRKGIGGSCLVAMWGGPSLQYLRQSFYSPASARPGSGEGHASRVSCNLPEAAVRQRSRMVAVAFTGRGGAGRSWHPLPAWTSADRPPPEDVGPCPRADPAPERSGPGVILARHRGGLAEHVAPTASSPPRRRRPAPAPREPGQGGRTPPRTRPPQTA